MWPVRVDKVFGLRPLMVFGALAIVAAVNLTPLLLSGLSLQEVLFHSSSGAIQLGIAVVFGVLCLATRRRGQIDLGAAGVDVRVGAERWFYEWADIEHLDEVKAGVKVSLHGRTAEQNQYNIINARFSSSAGALRQLLSEGQAYYAPGRRSSGSTVAPGDNLRRVRLKNAIFALAVLTVPMLLLLAATVIWAALDCAKTLDLQKNGTRTEAAVTRIYTDGCGRRGCSLDAQFIFAAGGRTFTGHGHLASDRDPNDPDLLYARAYRMVPVAYDTRRPDVVDLNFRDRVFQQNAYNLMWSIIGIVGGVFSAITMIFGLAILPSFLKAIRTPTTQG